MDGWLVVFLDAVGSTQAVSVTLETCVYGVYHKAAVLGTVACDLRDKTVAQLSTAATLLAVDPKAVVRCYSDFYFVGFVIALF